MRILKRSIYLFLLAVVSAISLSTFSSCREDKKKTPGEKVEEGLDKAGDKIEDAADDAGDKIEDAADDAGDKIEDATDKN